MESRVMVGPPPGIADRDEHRCLAEPFWLDAETWARMDEYQSQWPEPADKAEALRVAEHLLATGEMLDCETTRAIDRRLALNPFGRGYLIWQFDGELVTSPGRLIRHYVMCAERRFRRWTLVDRWVRYPFWRLVAGLTGAAIPTLEP